MEFGAGSLVIYNNVKIMINFPDFCSIYTTETYAIFHALEIIK